MIFMGFFSELFFANPIEWHQIRGAQMILTMKLISIAFDMDEDIRRSQENQPEIDESPDKPAETNISRKNRRKKWSDKRKEPEEQPNNTETELILSQMPSIFEYFGYALCPGTVVFGPWFSFRDYMNIFREPKWVSMIFHFSKRFSKPLYCIYWFSVWNPNNREMG